MVKVLAILLPALFIAVIFAPAAVVAWVLCRHRDPMDFDEPGAPMDPGTYGPFREAMLEDIGWMREQAHEEVWIRGPDGPDLCGEWYPRGNRAVILAHGYKSTPLNNFSGIGRWFLENGWSLLTIVERGHGKSGGKCTFGLKEADDLRAWTEWLDGREKPDEILLYGMSMGGAAVNMASPGPWPASVRGMISDCGYAGVDDQMQAMMQKMAFNRRMISPFVVFWMRAGFRRRLRGYGTEQLNKAARPMLFIGGGADSIVSLETVRRAYDACGAEKQMLTVENATHTTAYFADSTAVTETVQDFIDRSEGK